MRKVIIFLALIILMAGSAGITQAATFSIPKDNKQSNRISKGEQHTLIAVAENILIDAKMGGDVIAAGGLLNFNQKIDRNLFAVGQSIRTQDEIGGSAALAGSDITIGKKVSGNLFAAGDNITINADIGGDVFVAAKILTLAKGVTISGDLYGGVNEIVKPDSATVLGKTQIKNTSKKHQVGAIQRIWKIVYGWLTLLLLGLIIWRLFPKISQQVADNLVSRWSTSLLVGLAILILTPLTVILFLITGIGWIIGLILLAVYFILISLTPIFAALAVGKNLFKLSARPLIVGLFGLTIIVLLQQIPLIGGLTVMAVLLLGLGAAGITIYENYHKIKGGNNAVRFSGKKS